MTCFRLACLASAVTLAGCVSSGGGTQGLPEFLGQDGPLVAVALDSAGRTTGLLAGEIDGQTGTVTLGAETGSLGEDPAQVPLDGGGVVSFEAVETDFATAFDMTPQGADRTLGVIGSPTDPGDMPGGSAIYAGTATLTVLDGAVVYDLTGAATIEAGFDEASVTTTVTALSGSQQEGLSAPVDVSDIADLAFAGSVIEGTTFSGGTPALESGTLPDLSGEEISSLDGAFFGPGADEVGVAFAIDDSAQGTVTILGTILAD